MMNMTLDIVVEDRYDGVCLRDFLRGHGFSSSLIRSVKFLPDGITIDGVQAHTDRVLKVGETVCVRFAEDRSALEPCDIPLDILYESETLIVLNKPAGIATHPTLNYKTGTLANGYAKLMSDRGTPLAFRPAYRLDRDTSGCLLAAKSRLAASSAAASCKKTYLAVAYGETDDRGLVDAPIGLAPDSIIKRCVSENGKSAYTEYETLSRRGGYSLLRLRLITGRTHQIRVHMAHIGHALLGDTLYGSPSELIMRQALHCESIRFEDGGVAVELSAPIPDDFACLLRAAGFDMPI